MSSVQTLCLLIVAHFATGCASVSDNNPRIYDTKADGLRQLDVALQKARADNKRILLDLGANWCSDSQAMYLLLTTNAEIQKVIGECYILALVDVNKRAARERNTELQTRLNNPVLRIPVLLVLDGTGEVLNTDPAERLADSDHQHPDRVLAYLRKWAGNGTCGDAVRNDGRAVDRFSPR